MRIIALSLLASLAFGGPAIAANDHAIVTPPPHCMKIEEYKKAFDHKTRFEVLGPGAFHVAEGIYIGSPTTPPGLPPGDGAILVTHRGDKGALLIWTRGDQGCAPIAISQAVIATLAGIRTAAGEKVEPYDDGAELHL